MAAFSDDLFYASITELGKRLRAGEFSSVELTRAFLDRLEQIGPAYNALALSLRKQAVAKAKEADGDLKRERDRGPLHGIPFAAKDLLSLAGTVTTWGAKPFQGQVFDSVTATVLTKLDRAGAVLLGKLAMVELAGGGGYRYAAASATGPGLNPWNRQHWSGGSSSGSGIALAAGLAPFALGSETWGSILTPSAYCGVTGLRPTYGLVSRYGAMALSWTMDKIGPFCRTAEDCGLVLRTIAGKDANDPGNAGKSFYYVPQYAKKLADVRIAYAPVDFNEWIDPASRQAFQAALTAFRELGVQMVERRLPPMPYNTIAGSVIAAEGSSAFEGSIRNGLVDQLADSVQIAGLKSGLQMPAADYLRAMRLRTVVQQTMRGLLTDVDVVLSPSRFSTATRVDEPLDAPSGYRPPSGTDRGFRDLSAAGNLAGLPALSLPCGFVNSLPIAVQLVSRPFTENLLLSLGASFQAATPFHRQRPTLATPGPATGTR